MIRWRVFGPSALEPLECSGTVMSVEERMFDSRVSKWKGF